MRIWRQLAFLLAVLAPLAAAGEMVDRIVARVNRRVILESEVEDSLRYQAMAAGRDPARFSAEERKRAIDQLVDQALIEAQIDRATLVRASKEDVERQIATMRRQIPGASDDQGWRALLARYGLTENDIAQLVAEQLNIIRYVDARFRPNIHIDQRSIENYYLEQLIPQLHRDGAHEVPLGEVSGKIEEILVEQRINDLMTLWLQSLRGQEEVQELR
ncbi:MAG TPA: SurA N-terminal domain-containing protein [Terriglobales bacterium]|nr:SurA N-terminal domain-containing protein [Terriglobales bacterium]